MTTSDVRGTHIFHDSVTFAGALYLPTETIGDEEIKTDANNRIASTKVVHRIDLHYDQVGGTDVVSETKELRICRGEGTLLGVKVRPKTAPTGGDKAFTVDVKKAAEASGSFSTLLDSVVTVDSSSADNTVQDATLISDPTTDAEDCIQIVVTASGSTGSQGQGVQVTLFYEEDPS